MQARYICPDKSWILVNVLEKIGTLYRVYPVDWIGVEKEELYVPENLLEFIITDRM
jgi:hypothetical protein